jgi:hypothetical protein
LELVFLIDWNTQASALHLHLNLADDYRERSRVLFDRASGLPLPRTGGG